MTAPRVLYSFPFKIGAGRTSYTAWHQVNGLAAAGAEVLACPGVVHRELPPSVRVWPTLTRGRLRIPYRGIGQLRALGLHDAIVARRLPRLAGEIDVIHAWPSAALRTLSVAKRLGIPTVLERPNAHTRFGYDVVGREAARIGVTLPPGSEHSFQPDVLRKEEEEFRLADRLLCPSEFVVQTFLDAGFPPEKLVRHIYGFDDTSFYPPGEPRAADRPLTMLFVGYAAVRKGVHLALEAWLRSPASSQGRFLIAGDFLPEYEEKLAPMLADPSVHRLGHREDVAQLMRTSDIMVLPSLEEGFGLVCVEAMGSGCVPLVSDACTEVCVHMQNSLVHAVGDVGTLANHITLLHEERDALARLRKGALETAPRVTWTAAGERLLDAYREVIAGVNASSEDSGRLEEAVAP
jgi:glycosyltransferase involved in cell wall biosynthesis